MLGFKVVTPCTTGAEPFRCDTASPLPAAVNRTVGAVVLLAQNQWVPHVNRPCYHPHTTTKFVGMFVEFPVMAFV